MEHYFPDGMLYAISGPEDFAGISGKRAQGYQINLDRVELMDVWNAGGAGLARPHDVAVSVPANGSSPTEIYVVDLQPFNVIKLVYGEFDSKLNDAPPPKEEPGILSWLISLISG